jgi:uncharacterized protein YndB with AHSA1/START domain
MNRMKTILIALAALVVVFVIVAALQPAAYKVVRSTSIAAPPSLVFAHVNDLHKFQTWSPWANVDPNCKYTYEGPQAGAGAAFSWTGNAAVGAGKMTITDSRPNEVILVHLDFYKPFAGVGETEYGFKADGDKTTVSWTMSGKKNFMTKAIGLFVSMDKMLGPQFEKGLTQLKSIAESSHVAAVH